VKQLPVTDTVALTADALTDRIARRRVRNALLFLDREGFRRTAARTSPLLDSTMPALTRAADHSVLWMAIAGLLDASGTRPGRRAARRGLGCLAVTSLVANQVAKRVSPRPRPPIADVPLLRRARRVPTSSSFPSGHSASAAAFATGVSLEIPELTLPMVALAGAVCYSRIYTGVHYPGDVLAGAALGCGIAFLVERMTPTHTREPFRVPSSRQVEAPAIETGHGLVVVVNTQSASGRAGKMATILAAELPDARIIEVEPGQDVGTLLADAATTATVLGVAGGDGTVSTAARVAADEGLPLFVAPAGTFNHFAADLELRSLNDALAALRSGTAVAVDLATAGESTFLNTASVGGYPEFVAKRERLEGRLGKPLAALVAASAVVRRPSTPLAAEIDGRPHRLVMLFVGNCRYQPHGFAPRWRPRLDDGLLDVRFLEAGKRFSGLRIAAALLTGHLGRSRIYHEDGVVDLTIEIVDGSTRLALDGELGPGEGTLAFDKRRRALTVYGVAPRTGASPLGPGAEFARRVVAGPAHVVSRVASVVHARTPASTG